MTLQEFIEVVINDSVDNTRTSAHLNFPIFINGIELDFGDISVTHKGDIQIYITQEEN